MEKRVWKAEGETQRDRQSTIWRRRPPTTCCVWAKQSHASTSVRSSRSRSCQVVVRLEYLSAACLTSDESDSLFAFHTLRSTFSVESVLAILPWPFLFSSPTRPSPYLSSTTLLRVYTRSLPTSTVMPLPHAIIPSLAPPSLFRRISRTTSITLVPAFSSRSLHWRRNRDVHCLPQDVLEQSPACTSAGRLKSTPRSILGRWV